MFKREIWDKFTEFTFLKLQIMSGKFQNSTINDVKQISLSHVIMTMNYKQLYINLLKKLG